MAKIPDGFDHDELTRAARRVLLDGLFALEDHLAAITVIGAQAVYLRTSGAVVRSSGFTTDGDLGIDPELLTDEPRIEQALQEAGFLPMENQPGLWIKGQTIGGKSVEIELDLLVGKTLTRAGKRSARIPPHDRKSARAVEGIELACIDRSPMVIKSMDASDERSVGVNVAGPAALIVAKAFKIRDRLDQVDKYPDRLVDKDAADVVRIMMTTRPAQVAETIRLLQNDSRMSGVATAGWTALHELFGGSQTEAVEMAVRALRGDIPESRLRALAPAYVQAMK